MDELEFIDGYVRLAECSETRARAVYIHVTSAGERSTASTASLVSTGGEALSPQLDSGGGRQLEAA